MKTKHIFYILFFISILARAGDVATFVSLGWSPDDAYYAFAQYGEQDGSGFPYAEIFVVSVAENSFVPGGVIKNLWKEVDAKTDSIHVLLQSRIDADSLFKAYDIRASRQAQMVVPPVEGERERVSWSDGTMSIFMQQTAKGNPAMLESEAAFQLVLKHGEKDSTILGNPDRFRQYVMRYDIDRVLLADNQQSLVAVIKMTKIGFEGPDVRYMVETARLPE
jgi:predicted secreted protein